MKLNEELKVLVNEKRKEVIERIREAAAHGDLSENADYAQAREEQSFIEGRIQEIEDMIKNAEIALIVNTVEDRRAAIRDSYAIRRAALQHRVSLFTTLAGARAGCMGMEQAQELRAYSVQGLHGTLAGAAMETAS